MEAILGGLFIIIYLAVLAALHALLLRGLWGLARLVFKDLPEIKYKHFFKFAIFCVGLVIVMGLVLLSLTFLANLA